MAEVQTTTDAAGEKARVFIEFVMMHARSVGLCLGRRTDARGAQLPVNLPLARLLLEQLAIIREKTRGNLSPDEVSVLDSTLSDLEARYTEAARSAPTEPTPSSSQPS
ncbi:MAG: DUF1844 domain-containing protein [Verrucomicrobiota bacterium]|nr:DUF1844 domain-containing protein [Verrucomicrobiota bacterium]